VGIGKKAVEPVKQLLLPWSATLLQNLSHEKLY
jgi:hypothetical protein